MIKSPILLKDAYKADHRRQYPRGTTFVSSNLTARSSKYAPVPKDMHEDKVVFFGLNYFIREYLIDYWNENFFSKDVDEVCSEYEDFMVKFLGPNNIGSEHIRELHDYGRMPIRIKALPEGSRVPIQVPMLIIESTNEKFFWVTNFLETMLSCTIWKPIVSATTSFAFAKELRKWAEKTGGDLGFVPLQAHDFSFRGMSGLEDACISGMAHLTSSVGTDTIPAVAYFDHYYNGSEGDFVGTSVSATEHSVSCLSIVEIEESLEQSGEYKGYKLSDYGDYESVKEVSEYLMMKRYLTELYPSGIVSIVGDTFDYFRTMDKILPKLKDEILSRKGKYVSRPDSGLPIEIICGSIEDDLTDKFGYIEEIESWAREYLSNKACEEQEFACYGPDEVSAIFKYNDNFYKASARPFWNRYDKTYYYFDELENFKLVEHDPTPEEFGALNILWKIFGGHVNEKGYKVLHPNVGLIYGDSINFQSCRAICSKMEKMGFCSTNIVFGIGSWTYNGPVTRDSYGMAVKATFGIVNGEGRDIYKSPKTGSGKKSAKGLLAVLKDDNGDFYLRQEIPYDEYIKGVEGDQMQVVFEDGEQLVKPTLKEIRNRLWEGFGEFSLV